MPEDLDPLAPPSDAFTDAWQAQTLAIADAMVQAGHFTATQWAQALGQELANATHEPDTLQTYYLCALTALEKLSAQHTGLTSQTLALRKSAWVDAYVSTPHGAPVELAKSGERSAR